MSKKFNTGDTISLPVTIAYAYSDGAADIRLEDKGTAHYLPSSVVDKATLLKSVVPPLPAPKTAIDYYGSRYLVQANGGLAYVYASGATDMNEVKWEDLKHSNVVIVG